MTAPPPVVASPGSTLTMVDRLLPLSGLVAVVLQVAGFAMMDVSGYRPTGAEAVAIFTRDPDRIQAGALVGGSYSLVFLLVFVCVVAGTVRDRAGNARLAAIALGGGVTLTVALAIGYRVLNAGAFAAASPTGIGPDLATVLYRFYASTFAGFASFGLAAFLGATGVAALRHQFLPDLLGWVAVGSAVVLMTPAHAVGEAVGLIWIVVVSVLLFRAAPAAAS